MREGGRGGWQSELFRRSSTKCSVTPTFIQTRAIRRELGASFKEKLKNLLIIDCCPTWCQASLDYFQPFRYIAHFVLWAIRFHCIFYDALSDTIIRRGGYRGKSVQKRPKASKASKTVQKRPKRPKTSKTVQKCPKVSKLSKSVQKRPKVSKSVQSVQKRPNCPKASKVSKSVQKRPKCPKVSKLSKSVQKRPNSPKVSKSVSRGVQNTTKSPKPKIL